jgi:hypothetical protein
LRHPGNEIGFPSPLARGLAAPVNEPRRKSCRFIIDRNRSNTCLTISQRGSPLGD